MKKKWIWIAPAAIAGLALFIFLGGVIVEQLWNWLLPPLFGWHQITFWQGLGLLALCRILFGGWGSHGGSGPGWRRHKGEHHGHMTPEEREHLRQRTRERCGFEPPGAENQGQA
jgi:hypothetical protein